MAPNTSQARAGAHKSWSRTEDRTARTAPGTAAFMAKFEKQVDPEGRLAPEVRAAMAEHARKAYFIELSEKAARARAAKRYLEQGSAA